MKNGFSYSNNFSRFHPSTMDVCDKKGINVRVKITKRIGSVKKLNMKDDTSLTCIKILAALEFAQGKAGEIQYRAKYNRRISESSSEL